MGKTKVKQGQEKFITIFSWWYNKFLRNKSGSGAVWLARAHGVREVAGSSPVSPTSVVNR